MKLAARQLTIDVAVGNKKIFPAIVVVIEKTNSEAEILGVYAEPGSQACVLERTVPVIAIQNRNLIGEVCARNVEPAVAVIIADCDAHAGQSHAVFIESASRGDRRFSKRSVMVVAIEKAGRSIARYIYVGPAVVVEIGDGCAHAIRTR